MGANCRFASSTHEHVDLHPVLRFLRLHISLLTASGAALIAAVGVVILLAGRSHQASVHEPKDTPAAATASPSPRSAEIA
jgi:hypothetical protein